MVSAFCLTPTPSYLATSNIFCVQTSPCSCLNHTSTNPKHFRINHVFQQSPPPYKCSILIAKATNSNQQNTKPNSVICGDCDGNGAVQCSQCKGTGVNSVDVFNGQFKAGDSCWLCGGRKEILCGNCNGAGFIGGFLSTYDQ